MNPKFAYLHKTSFDERDERILKYICSKYDTRQISRALEPVENA
jgi:hypothetical protein